MNSRTMLMLLAVPVALTGCTTMEAQIRSSGTMGQVDADYANTAYQLIQLDRQAGKLAATKAVDPRVQSLATTLMAQADAFSPGLQSALSVGGIRPSTSLPQDEAAQIDALSKANGSAFDRQYVAAELAIHQRAVTVLQQEDAATKDGALRTQVETEMPAVQNNLATLQILSDEFNGKKQG